MKAKFYLRPNKLGTAPGTQAARVISPNVLNTDHIIQKLLQRHSTITEADARAVLTVFYEVVCDEVAEGNTVNLPVVNIRPGIVGAFSSKTDKFDPSRHRPRAVTSAGTLLKQKIADLTFVKVNKPPRAPMLIGFKDVGSGNSSSLLTPGGIGMIYGEELKFDLSNVEEGVFLINEQGLATKVEGLATRTQLKVVFPVPSSLQAGKYTLEVRRFFGSASPVLRTGQLKHLLEVL